VAGLDLVGVPEQFCEQWITPMNRSPFLYSRQHGRDVGLQETCHLGVRRFGNRLDTILAPDHMPLDFCSAIEELVKYLHFCRVCSIAHHASASGRTLSESRCDCE
jgi:hypothetical protein